jgi:hypothetical protein
MLPSLLVPTLTGVAVVEDGVDVVEYGVDVVEYGVDVVEDGVVVTVVVPVLEAQLEIGFTAKVYQVLPTTEKPDVVPSVHLT